MALANKYQWAFQGKHRSWTFNLQKEGFSGSVTKFKSGNEILIEWGRQSSGLDDLLHASYLEVSVIDPSQVIFNDLSGDSEVESNFLLVATDSTGNYTWRGRVRLNQTQTALYDELGVRVTVIYAYCGLSQLKDIDAVTLTSSTMHNTVKTILASHATDQDIEYLTGNYPSRVASSGPVLDLFRLNRLDLIYSDAGPQFVERGGKLIEIRKGTSGRKASDMRKQFEGILQGLGAVCFNGLDGKWHVKNRLGIGEEVTGKRGAQHYSASSGVLTTLNTLSASLYTTNSRLVSASATKQPLRPVQAVEIERGNTRGYVTVDVMRGGGFENAWATTTSHGAIDDDESDDYSRSTDSDTGTYSLSFSGQKSIHIRGPFFAGGNQEIDIEWAIRYAFRSLSASTVSAIMGIIPRIKGDNNIVTYTGGLYWSNGSLTGFQVSTTAVGSADSLVWETLVTTTRGPMPTEDGYLDLDLLGSNNHL